MDELQKLTYGFYKEYSLLLLSSIFISILSSVIETIIVPKLLSNIFNNINDIIIFKENLIFILFIYILIKIVYSLSIYLRRQLEPEMTHYILINLITKIFNKYEHDNELTNISVLINRIQLIKRNFQELMYILTNIFIPRTLVIILSCYTVYTINKTLGKTIFFCLFSQIFIGTTNLNDCLQKSYIENETKDILYEYIEDLFYNIDTIAITPNGFQHEIKNLLDSSFKLKEIERDALDCVSHKQNQNYVVNFFITCIIFYTIYKLYISKEILPTQITTTILLLTGMFDNMSEIGYYIPEATSKLGTLLGNEEFLKSLNSYDISNNNDDVEMKIINGNIEIKNISFNYENHKLFDNFSIVIPQKSFICIYGPSGSGKSTFIKLLYGILKPSSGNILFGGNDISKFHIRETRKYIAYLNQNTTNLFNTTVYKNIIYGYSDSPQLKQQILDLFINFDLYGIFKNLDENKDKWSFLNENVGKLGDNLSGGQKQIIHLLRLDLNNISNTVILDEPSSALDDKTRDNISKYIKYINSKGKTIILISHDNFYKNICDKILKFSNDENPILL